MNCPLFPTKWFLATILVIAAFAGGAEAAPHFPMLQMNAIDSLNKDTVGASQASLPDSSAWHIFVTAPTTFSADSFVFFARSFFGTDAGNDSAYGAIYNRTGTDITSLVAYTSKVFINSDTGSTIRWSTPISATLTSGNTYAISLFNMTNDAGVGYIRCRTTNQTGNLSSNVRTSTGHTGVPPASITGESTTGNPGTFVYWVVYGHTGSTGSSGTKKVGLVKLGGVKL